MGIRGRLLLGYFAVIVILIASGALIVHRLSREMRTNVESDALNLATALMGEIDQAMRDRIQSVSTLAGTSRTLHAALEVSNAEFRRLGSRAQIEAEIGARNRAWEAADKPTAFMREILQSSISAYLIQWRTYHKDGDGTAVFGEIFLTNEYGANVGQSGRTEDYEQADEPWWKSAWAEGIWISPLVKFDRSIEKFSIDIAVRLDAAAGRPLGVLKAVLDVGVLARIVESFALRSRLGGAYVELLDGEGLVIHRQGEPGAFRDDLSAEVAVRLARAKKRGTLVETTSRGELFRAFVRSQKADEYENLGWVLTLNHPKESAFLPLKELQSWALGVGIIGSLLAVLVGLFLSRAFVRITNRLQSAGASLQESESRVRAIVSHVVDGIVTIFPDGQIETVNPAVERIFGYGEQDLIGRNVSMLLPEAQDSVDDKSIRTSLLGREVVGRRKGGAIFPVDLAVGEIRESEALRFVAVMRDATDRHEARRVLHEAKEEAEAASRSKGEFLANMSHELRTPLNAILGYTEMVTEELEERGEKDLTADLEKVRISGRNLLGLINDVLDVSKIEAGRTDVLSETFDFGVFLREVTGSVRPLIEANGNELEIDVRGGFHEIHTDKTKLRQILLNLLSNASKFTRQGRIRLAVRRPQRDDRGWMEISVGDTGIGMTDEQVRHVWDAFAQADASTTREFGGTGLGLTITRSFCELLGGGIGVDSEPGVGTTFTLRLPVEEPGPAG